MCNVCIYFCIDMSLSSHIFDVYCCILYKEDTHTRITIYAEDVSQSYLLPFTLVSI